MSEEELSRYNKSLQKVEELESLYEKTQKNRSGRSLKTMLEMSEAVEYDYDSKGKNQATIQHCDSLKNRIVELKADCKEFYERITITSGKIDLLNVHNDLTETTVTYPVYVNQGELLFYNIKTESS